MEKIKHNKGGWLCLFVSVLLASCHTSSKEEGKHTITADREPIFQNFEYVGNDKIYKENPLPEGHFYSPVLQGCYPDPSITRKGNDYYLVTSSFVMFPGVPIFHSNDLVNWKQIGHVLDRESQLQVETAGISTGIRGTG